MNSDGDLGTMQASGMKLLFILPELALGGAEVLVTKLAIAFKELGHEVQILTFRETTNYLVTALQTHGIKLIYTATNQLYAWGNVRFLASYLRHQQFTLIHAHLTPAQLCAALARSCYGIKTPLITTEHNTYNRRRRLIFKPFDYFLYAQFEQIIAISEATRTALVQWIPNVQNKCQVILNGIDLNEFMMPIREPNQLDDNRELIVICVARFDQQKGHEVLLKALAATQHLQLQLVGDGVLRMRLQQLAWELGISARVHFWGCRADVAALLAKADIYVQPSLWEGFGIAAVEAMACGLPIIASNVAGLADVVGDAGILFPKADVERLAELLTLVAADAALRQTLAKRARARALQFDLAETVQGYLGLYQTIVAPQGEIKVI